mgnify:FL=1
MACAVTDLDSTSGCDQNEGGLTHSYVAKLADISAITLTSGVITAMTMASTGLWKRLDYDKDETSYFNETGARVNETGPQRLTQESFMKFGGLTSTYKTWSDDATDCCKLVFIHVHVNGARRVQGIEVDTSATGNLTGSKIRDTKVTTNHQSGTGAEESRFEAFARGITRKAAPYTDLTDTEIEAL